MRKQTKIHEIVIIPGVVLVLHLVLPGVVRHLQAHVRLALLLALLRHNLLVLLALLLENVARGRELGEVVAVQLAAALPIVRKHRRYLTKTALKELQRVRCVANLQHLLSQLVRQLLVVRDGAQRNHVHRLLRVADEGYGN